MNTTKSTTTGALSELAQKYHFSEEGVEAALTGLKRTGGSSAQFSHPELGGSVQWMRGGMTQIGDMFNNDLKQRVANLCADIAGRLNDFEDAKTEKTKSADESPKRSHSEWPSEWGSPSSSGGQNDIRYAFFPDAHRLVVEEHGKKTVYDSGSHKINGVAQQQGAKSKLAFSTNDGPVDVSSLKVIPDSEH